MRGDPKKTRVDRPVEFMGSSRGDLSSFPSEVKLVMAYALRQIQDGKTHVNVKAMRGTLRDVVEISVGDASGERTFRTTCTAKIGDVIYVLHAFQKKIDIGYQYATTRT